MYYTTSDRLYRENRTYTCNYKYGYNGEFGVTLLLSAAAIAFLVSDPILSFVITAMNGDFVLKDVTLNLTVEDIPLTMIPLPAGAWLLLSGVGGLALLRRRSHI